MSMIKVPNPFYERNEEIRKLYKEGLSLREIGARVGITGERVRQALNKENYKFYIRRSVGPTSWRNSGRDMVRGMVRERDGFKCKRCKRKWQEGERAFDVHHLNGMCGKRSRGYDKIKDMPGLITYCHKCHMGLHSVRSKRSDRWSKWREEKRKGVLKIRIELMKIARKKGLTFDQIGEIFGIKQAAVYKFVNDKK